MKVYVAFHSFQDYEDVLAWVATSEEERDDMLRTHPFTEKGRIRVTHHDGNNWEVNVCDETPDDPEDMDVNVLQYETFRIIEVETGERITMGKDSRPVLL